MYLTRRWLKHNVFQQVFTVVVVKLFLDIDITITEVT